MGTEISLATRLWTGRGVQVSTNYNSALENYYSGDIRAVNFAEPTNTATAINEWVRQATKNNIRSLVEPGEKDWDYEITFLWHMQNFSRFSCVRMKRDYFLIRREKISRNFPI